MAEPALALRDHPQIIDLISVLEQSGLQKQKEEVQALVGYIDGMEEKLSQMMDEMKAIWAEFKGRPQELQLPMAPKQFLHYFEEPDRPQSRLDRDLERGMAVSIGRLRPDTQYDYKFVCLSHNTLRGAAGGAVELAELLCAEGYITRR